ncbi:MAG TPA: proton-conducting transporter membrane subunit [Thiobacillaceae bacterium]|nr:proton-conducting transporter membrane subunit [Thiobacillaceae bacterium]HNA81646.1 proton-conducting transporter membrane subunit [Thiobacillaceae bacterium]HNH88475.1 proton-conducting transporter membrane subunit [Thiobacillaceae bacterium]HNI06889.1 proton-conducting transporter membrane subunit [Thiobacillaceae bacterium]
MHELAVLLPAAPLASAILIGLLSGRLAGRRHQLARLSVGFAALTCALALGLLLQRLDMGPPSTVDFGWASLYLDPLGSVMALLVSAISLVVHVYSVRYMAEDPGYTRFFVLLDLMTMTILLMVSAGDLVTLLVAWHLVGVLLYFLLGHDLNRPSAQRYAFWTLFTFRLGDLPLVLAALLLYQAYDTLSLAELFQRLAADPHAGTVLGLPLAPSVGLLVALAAFARSAQFPLHTWLPYTMEGPTPVSALMHAGIVNAGGFLLNRFAPVYVHAGEVLHLVFAVGLVTALLGSVLMLTQNDIKKALGYSTMGQMGFMFVECGVGAFSLAIYHLIAHGLFKGTLFLGAGGMIGVARKDDGVPHDEVYTFVVERRPGGSRLPWLMAAAITVIVPFLLLGLTRWFLGGGFVGEQGAVILLFFGWVTGAQLLFATYRLQAENPWRMMAMIILSLTIVVAGYTLMEHAFGRFLYPDAAFSQALYAAASIPLPLFYGLVTAITLVVVLGWLAAFYNLASGGRRTGRASPLQLTLYSLVSREFYVADLYAWLSQRVLDTSRRLNVWSRWV